MSEPKLKARDKVVVKMTKTGAVEENLATGEVERISERVKDAELVKKSADETLEEPEKRKRRYMHPSDDKTAVEQTSAAVFDEETEPEQADESEAESADSSDIISDNQPEVPEAAEDSEPADTSEILEPEEVEEEYIPSRKVEKLERKSEKAHQKLDEAYDKLPKKKFLKSERVFDEETGKAHKRLYFEEEVKAQKPPSKLKFEAKKVVTQAGGVLAFKLHGKIHEVEQDNSAVEAAHKTELAAEVAARHIHFERSIQSPYEKYSKLEQRAEEADRKLRFERTYEENPELRENRDMNKFYQKSRNKKAAKEAGDAGYDAAEDSAERIKATAEKVAEKVKEFVKENKILFAWIGAGLLIIIICAALFASCTAMISQVSSQIAGTTYLSEDEDMLGAESAYKALEESLQAEIDSYESTHNYDEYIYNLDEIYHDPYVLISLLSAMNDGEFELSDVEGFLSTLFEMQYELTEEVTVETRYRTETQTEWRLYIDPYTGMPVYDPYTGQYLTYPVEVEVQVPYDYYICTVTLTSADLDAIARELLNEEQLLLYEAYLENKGNREELFG